MSRKEEYTIDELKRYMDEGKFGKVENYIRKNFECTDNREYLKVLKDYFKNNVEKPPWWKILKKISYHSLSLTLGIEDFNKKLKK